MSTSLNRISFEQASTRVPAGIEVRKGKEGTILLCIPRFSVGLVQPESRFTTDFNRAVKAAELDIIADQIESKNNPKPSKQGALYFRYADEAEYQERWCDQTIAKHLVHHGLTEHIEKPAMPGDHLDQAVLFLQAFEARRQRGIEHLRKFGIALRTNLAAPRTSPSPD